MYFIYNILQILLLIMVSPVLVLLVLTMAKFRTMMTRRLGRGIASGAEQAGDGTPRIWIHALSVGEVASARSLVTELRRRYPAGCIIFSASTRTGENFARSVFDGVVDLIVPMPLDLLPIVKRYIQSLRPDFFILVETDFWPNFLHELTRRRIPAILVNGRFSEASLSRYRKMRFFFRPLFRTFRAITMQSKTDGAALVAMGVGSDRIFSLGNLKYDSNLVLPDSLDEEDGDSRAESRRQFGIPAPRFVWLAGSTHQGEEEVLLAVFAQLIRQGPIALGNLFLIIAPRNVERGPEVLRLAAGFGLRGSLRSSGADETGNDILILDTLGELAGLYRQADLAFIGGSLVPEGGHNPLEAAAAGCPVFFGPHMEDFSEVAQNLVIVGGARQVRDADELAEFVEKIIEDTDQRRHMARQGRELVAGQQGAAVRHLELISRLIEEEKGA